jgi:hypothetical protein
LLDALLSEHSPKSVNYQRFVEEEEVSKTPTTIFLWAGEDLPTTQVEVLRVYLSIPKEMEHQSSDLC